MMETLTWIITLTPSSQQQLDQPERTPDRPVPYPTEEEIGGEHHRHAADAADASEKRHDPSHGHHVRAVEDASQNLKLRHTVTVKEEPPGAGDGETRARGSNLKSTGPGPKVTMTRTASGRGAPSHGQAGISPLRPSHLLSSDSAQAAPASGGHGHGNPHLNLNPGPSQTLPGPAAGSLALQQLSPRPIEMSAQTESQAAGPNATIMMPVRPAPVPVRLQVGVNGRGGGAEAPSQSSAGRDWTRSRPTGGGGDAGSEFGRLVGRDAAAGTAPSAVCPIEA